MPKWYTYRDHHDGDSKYFPSRIRKTRGIFNGITEPCGLFGFRYARFSLKSSDLYIPVHDLTPETVRELDIPALLRVAENVGRQ